MFFHHIAFKVIIVLKLPRVFQGMVFISLKTILQGYVIPYFIASTFLVQQQTWRVVFVHLVGIN